MSKKPEGALPDSIISEAIDYHLRSRPDLFSIKSFPVTAEANKRWRDERAAVIRDFNESDKHLQECCDRQSIVDFVDKDKPGVNYTFNDGETPLIRAVKNGHYKFAKALIEFGARVDDTDSYDKTALHWAAEMGRADLSRMLLEHGADRTLKDAYNMTPFSDRSGYGYMRESALTSAAMPKPHPDVAVKKLSPTGVSSLESASHPETEVHTKPIGIAEKKRPIASRLLRTHYRDSPERM